MTNRRVCVKVDGVSRIFPHPFDKAEYINSTELERRVKKSVMKKEVLKMWKNSMKSIPDVHTCHITKYRGERDAIRCQDSSCPYYDQGVECPVDCKCLNNILNMTFPELKLRWIERKGWCLATAEDIRSGSTIIEMVGVVRLSSDIYKNTVSEQYSLDIPGTPFSICCSSKGNLGRFVSTSCSPNCYITTLVSEQQMRLILVAKRFIKKGEELSVNYKESRKLSRNQPQKNADNKSENELGFTCLCGHSNCVSSPANIALAKALKRSADYSLDELDRMEVDIANLPDKVPIVGSDSGMNSHNGHVTYNGISINPKLPIIRLVRTLPKSVHKVGNSTSNVKRLRRSALTQVN